MATRKRKRINENKSWETKQGWGIRMEMRKEMQEREMDMREEVRKEVREKRKKRCEKICKNNNRRLL